METKNTYDDVAFNPARRCGNTTRQIDKSIQLLFEGYVIKVIDHWENGRHDKANRHLFDGILRRLQSEHNLQRLMNEDSIRIDRGKSEIELLSKFLL